MKEIQFRSDFDVKYKQHMGSDEIICEAAKVSAQGLAAQDAKESERLIKFLANERHGSPFEHTAMTFIVTEPVFCTREFHRHRVGWSYNEESSRWKQLEPVFYIPTLSRPIKQIGKTGDYLLVPDVTQNYDDLTHRRTTLAIAAYREYEAQLAEGVAREVARQVLPVNLYTSFYATCNARSLMHFLSLRMDKTALWEIRQIANQAFAIFKDLFPLTANAFVEAGLRGV